MAKKAEAKVETAPTPKAKPVERARIPVHVDNGRLVAFDAAGQEMIDRLPLGRIIAEIDQAEPEDGLRAFFFAGLNLLAENCDEVGPGRTFPTSESLRKYLLKEVGFAEAVVRIDGVKWVPVSMARGAMDYPTLNTCVELVQQFVVHKWGWNPWTTWSEENSK